MTNFLVKIKNLSIITIIASLVVGLVLLIKPNEALQFVSLFCGAIIILIGIGSWIYYFAKDSSPLLAISGTIELIVGIVICVKYKSIITIVLFVFGIFLIVSGVVDLISSVNAKKNGVIGWLLSLLMAVAIIVLGVVITVNPFSSVVLVTRLLGVGLLVYAIVDLIAFFQVKKVAKLKTVVDDDVVEVDISQEDIE